ncbi:hypothetical protein COEREDRAFT_83794 [Coemansia reversa NRRL 1564]|uniref:Uncharacterized protein n=1 Tax=Coemansia reversa (strain ATCC 12441 / NRRL 1564) TaxID=763665 RepID=A0A2G5B1S7_COERN|nr:hypothetical protein COEREDRAFT_83794 [Coemansia reversa NRRL 1564]|eukprot:PIA12965.1 hypothetical protein COEREDRAFT_83794 [Coemansia reversa NRRL 1564]
MSSPINYSPLSAQPISIPHTNMYLNASPIYQSIDGRYNSAPIDNSGESPLRTPSSRSIQGVQSITPNSAIPPHMCNANSDIGLNNSPNQFTGIYGSTPSAELDRSSTSLNLPYYGSQIGNGVSSGNYPGILINGIHPSATHSTDPSMDVGPLCASDIYANTMGTSQESFYYNYMSSLNDPQPTCSGANASSVFGAENRTPIIGGQPLIKNSNEGVTTEFLQHKRPNTGDSPNSLSNVPLIEHPGFSSTSGAGVAINHPQDFSGTNPMLDFYILQQQQQQQQQTSYSMPNFPNSNFMLTSGVVGADVNADALLTKPSVDDSVYTDLMSQFGMLPNGSTVGEGNMDSSFYNTSENIGYTNATHAENVQQWQQQHQEQMMGLDGSGISPELTISPASAITASNRNTDLSSNGSQP